MLVSRDAKDKIQNRENVILLCSIRVMMKINLKKKGEWNPDYAFPM